MVLCASLSCGDDDGDVSWMARIGWVYKCGGQAAVVHSPLIVTANLETGGLTAPLRRSGQHRTFL